LLFTPAIKRLEPSDAIGEVGVTLPLNRELPFVFSMIFLILHATVMYV
jgi:hypothetical protein